VGDALADEEGPGVASMAGSRQDLIEGLRREIDRGQPHVPGNGAEPSGDDVPFHGLCRWMVELEDTDLFALAHAIGSTVQHRVGRVDDHAGTLLASVSAFGAQLVHSVPGPPGLSDSTSSDF
jgi:hypothetical protein